MLILWYTNEFMSEWQMINWVEVVRKSAFNGRKQISVVDVPRLCLLVIIYKI